MLENEHIKQRINQLRLAIAYSRDQQKIMSIGEGIMCHQEIAAWFRVLDGEVEQPKYTITKVMETKVTEIQNIISQTGWEKPQIF